MSGTRVVSCQALWRARGGLAGSALPWSTVCVGTRERYGLWARRLHGSRRGALSGPVAFPTIVLAPKTKREACNLYDQLFAMYQAWACVGAVRGSAPLVDSHEPPRYGHTPYATVRSPSAGCSARATGVGGGGAGGVTGSRPRHARVLARCTIRSRSHTYIHKITRPRCPGAFLCIPEPTMGRWCRGVNSTEETGATRLDEPLGCM